jgi:high affinity Mn2+ porin
MMLVALAWIFITLSPPAMADEDQTSNLHLQATTVTQGHPSFTSPYSGVNSLTGSGETKTSFTTTLFAGYSPWKNGSLILNPEVSAGEGLSKTHGVAGFPNGEIYRVDTPGAKLYLSRIYLQQIFELGGETEVLADSKNQLAAKVDRRRITLIGGEFSLNDFFDDNLYSHDPRTQFLNWSLMDNGAWDYAADTRGYTWGFYTEYNEPNWAIRFASVLQPKEANGLDMDLHLWEVFGDNLEYEYRYILDGHPGKARVLGYLNRAHMGNYAETLANPSFGEDITLTRENRLKYGFLLNLEQEVSARLGSFLRIGWADGNNETWIFTEVDQTASLGLSLKGSSWNRSDDTVGLAAIVNGLCKNHADYLSSGGYGFLLGDGHLNYAPEEIVESYYLFQWARQFGVTADFQFVNHPGYNSDRGPAGIISARLHYEI